MQPSLSFRFCPRCAAERPTSLPQEPFRCAACGFLYFFNPAVASAAILLDPKGSALFIKRAKEPSKGKLGMAGGFIDIGETAEEGLRREVREEVNLELDSIQFLCSQPNAYEYQGVTYPVLDLFFVARTSSPASAAALDAVESFCWLDPLSIDPGDLAFPSMQEAMRFYQRQASGSTV
jgi:NAD+ diphosphatase